MPSAGRVALARERPAPVGLFWLFVLPFAALTAVFGVWPIVLSVQTSFTASASALKPSPTWVGLANYASIFADPVFVASLWRTLLYTLLAVISTISLALLYALLLNSVLIGRGRTFFKLSVFLPVVTPDIAGYVICRCTQRAGHHTAPAGRMCQGLRGTARSVQHLCHLVPLDRHRHDRRMPVARLGTVRQRVAVPPHGGHRVLPTTCRERLNAMGTGNADIGNEDTGNTHSDPFAHLHNEDYGAAYQRLTITAETLVALGRRQGESLDGPWHFTLDLLCVLERRVSGHPPGRIDTVLRRADRGNCGRAPTACRSRLTTGASGTACRCTTSTGSTTAAYTARRPCCTCHQSLSAMRGCNWYPTAASRAWRSTSPCPMRWMARRTCRSRSSA